MDIFATQPYLTGRPPKALPPLGRFLPPVLIGPVSDWLADHIPPGAWILDPFGASPALTVEVARAGYRVLVAANNPVTRFLIEMAAVPPTASDLQGALAALGSSRKENERLENHIQSLYLTECANCRRTIQADAFIWDKKSELIVGRIYTCPYCNDNGEREATPMDIENAAKWSATSAMHRARALERVASRNDPDRIHAEEAIENYPPRAIYALGTLINRLDQLELSSSRRRALMALILNACDVGDALWPHPIERRRPRQLTMPIRYRENNIWKALEDGIALWAPPEDGRGDFVSISFWPDVPAMGGICIFEGALRELALKLKDKSIKAIIGAIPRPNQAFWTLSAVWAGWLWGREAVGPFKVVLRRRRYDWQWHAEALRAALGSLSNVLPARIPFFALLSEPEAPFISAALLAAQVSGFGLRGIAMRTADDPIQIVWEKAQVGTATSPFDKTIVREALQAYLLARGEPVTYLHLHTVSVAALAEKGALAWTSEALKEIDEVVQQALDLPIFARYEGHTGPETGYWGMAEDTVSPLLDKVEVAVVRLIQRNPGFDLGMLEKEVNRQFQGVLTPPIAMIDAILKSYAASESGLRLRDEDNPAARRFDLEAMRGLLEIVAVRVGYEIDRRGENLMLWKDGTEVVYAFHLSASALIGSIARDNSFPPDRTVVVIPGGRASLVAYKLKRDPGLRTRTAGWRFIKFRHLRQIAELPLLTRETWEEQLNMDPIEQDSGQMMMF
jgi:hypothetical protein